MRMQPAVVFEEGDVSLKRRKSEYKEKERQKLNNFLGLFAYGESFRKRKLSGKLCIVKYIFSDQITFMVHIPFEVHDRNLTQMKKNHQFCLFAM